MKKKNLAGILAGTAVLAAGISGAVTRNVTLQEARQEREEAIQDILSSVYVSGVEARVNPVTKAIKGNVEISLYVFNNSFEKGVNLHRKIVFAETPQWYDFGCETIPDPTYASWTTKVEDSDWK